MTAAKVATLSEFLLARIAEDEKIASTIEARGRWAWREFPARTQSLSDDNSWAPYFSVEFPQGYVYPVSSVMAHIARHDPARVLAECKAKRRIVEEFTMITLLDYEHPIGPAEGAYVKAQQILKHLAAVYADHPDYRTEWRP